MSGAAADGNSNVGAERVEDIVVVDLVVELGELCREVRWRRRRDVGPRLAPARADRPGVWCEALGMWAEGVEVRALGIDAVLEKAEGAFGIVRRCRGESIVLLHGSGRLTSMREVTELLPGHTQHLRERSTTSLSPHRKVGIRLSSCDLAKHYGSEAALSGSHSQARTPGVCSCHSIASLKTHHRSWKHI